MPSARFPQVSISWINPTIQVEINRDLFHVKAQKSRFCLALRHLMMRQTKKLNHERKLRKVQFEGKAIEVGVNIGIGGKG